ncbi:hypothetical protein GYMLUDRAFT_264477 [Collybiopsis luxurians FD-317 M1]|uniref:Peptidase S9 prolyl oligopeptidase catalytic domain-containing protein n=1 Tax=Collybiopsis luxurians FD-317 M1 TaxID=944289 RepID=A0A0D0CIE5_9AGAR|nr:hypothetical protein GYMLUDRAFT_264477 [Collybiopsis luxurians FD-317 M1]
MSGRAPYGTWKSPIIAERVSGSSTSIDDIIVDAVTSVVYHLEGRPADKGRCVLVESLTGCEIVPKDVNVRSGVHEYGGAAAIVHDGVAYYSNFADNRVYKIGVKEGSQPEAVTPGISICGFDIHPVHPQFLVSVLEDHTIDSPLTVTNTLVIIDAEAKTIDTSTTSLVDITVNTSSEVAFSNSTTVADEGSNGYISWVNMDTLCFVSDVSGFINPWTYSVSTEKASPVFSSPVNEDFGSAMWLMCYFPYAIVDEDGKVAVFKAFRDGRSILYRVDLGTGERQEVQSPYVVVESVRTVSRSQGQFAFLGSKVDESQKVIIGSMMDTDQASFTSLNTMSDEVNRKFFDASLVSIPQGMTLKVPLNDEPLQVIYYSPHNPALDVNYGGSTGYGKAYMDRLKQQWGKVDVEDCIAAAQILSNPPYSLIDPRRIVIRGSSAGGFTLLNCLSNSSNPQIFAAATSLFAVVDVERLVRDIHKFESQYMFLLAGGSPTNTEPLKAVSPINHFDRIDCPLLILQGEKDRVVPKEQAEILYESVKKRGGIVEYKLYPGEGHGLRMKETLCDAFEREFEFYQRVLGFRDAPP